MAARGFCHPGAAVPVTRDGLDASNVLDTWQSDELARRKAAEFEAIFESLADGLLIVDSSAQIVGANRAMARMLGFADRADLLGSVAQNLHARLMRDDGAPLTHEDVGVRRALRGGETVRGTCVVRPEYGGPCWVETIVSPICDADGSVMAASILARDTTAQRWWEWERTLLDRATDVVLAATDVDGALGKIASLAVDWPSRCCAVYLLDEQADALRLVAFRGADRRTTFDLAGLFDNRPLKVGEGFVGAAMRAGETLALPDLSEETVRRYGAGVAESALLRRLDLGALVCVPLRGADRSLGVLVVGWERGGHRLSDQDVHLADELARRAALAVEQVRCISALEESLERLELVLNSMGAGLVILGGDGQAILVNDTAALLLGLRDDGIGRTLPHLLLGAADRFEDTREIDDLVARVGDRTLASRGAFRLREPAAIDVEWVATPVLDERDMVLGQVIVWLDVTHLRTAERQKDALAADLNDALRSPLHSISTYAVQALRRARRAGSDQIVAHGLEVILRHARQVSMHVTDLVDAAYFDPETLTLDSEEVDVREVVEHAIDRTRALSHIHRFRLDIPDALPHPQWDPDRARQALLHVLSNAVKFWPEGGLITVKVRPRLEGIVISVRDRGLGIPGDDHERVFERFYRVAGSPARRQIRGHGLGLFLVNSIVEAHGGTAWIESAGAPGEGTTVYLLMPWEPVSTQEQ
jgi:PAS domain S-box-containing protein